jgi:stage II sporulation protein D
MRPCANRWTNPQYPVTLPARERIRAASNGSSSGTDAMTRFTRWMILLALLAPPACTQTHQLTGPNPAAPVVRVRLLQSQQQIILSGTESPLIRVGSSTQSRRLNLPRNAGVAVTLAEGAWRIGNVPVGRGELVIQPAIDGTLAINGKPYHGVYRLVPLGTTFDVINHVDIDSYLKSVLPCELLKNWHDETYKALAITARTYALYEARTRGTGQPFDLFADTRSQVYGGIAEETPRSRRAVDETSGVVLVYGPAGNEHIFKAYFSSCCGGITQSAADAFGEAYIEPLSDQNVHGLCVASKRYNWGPVIITKEELTRRFRAWGKRLNRPEQNMSNIQAIDIQFINRWGRPTRFVITDAGGARYSLTSEELRVATNTNATDTTRLYSSFVKTSNEPDVVRFFDGHGLGHGVGLCQYCSEARAEAGMRHEDIVLSAFQRAKLARAY